MSITTGKSTWPTHPQSLFREGWRPRLRLADADRSGAIELTDAIVILRYLFQGEARPGV